MRTRGSLCTSMVALPAMLGIRSGIDTLGRGSRAAHDVIGVALTRRSRSAGTAARAGSGVGGATCRGGAACRGHAAGHGSRPPRCNNTALSTCSTTTAQADATLAQRAPSGCFRAALARRCTTGRVCAPGAEERTASCAGSTCAARGTNAPGGDERCSGGLGPSETSGRTAALRVSTARIRDETSLGGFGASGTRSRGSTARDDGGCTASCVGCTGISQTAATAARCQQSHDQQSHSINMRSHCGHPNVSVAPPATTTRGGWARTARLPTAGSIR